jgi:hypothetical protein
MDIRIRRRQGIFGLLSLGRIPIREGGLLSSMRSMSLILLLSKLHTIKPPTTTKLIKLTLTLLKPNKAKSILT